MKYNWQLSAINSFSKIGLIASLVVYEGFVDSNYFSPSFYHFISLYGVICFIFSLYFEYERENFILSFLSLLFLITYQPLYPILIRKVFIRGMRPNEIVLLFTAVIIIPWIIFDIIRWVIDYRKNKKVKMIL